MAEELLWCLANSQKLGGRCIAGHTKSGNFKRPISKAPDGTLHQFHYRLDDGTEPQILEDLIKKAYTFQSDRSHCLCR